MPYLPKESRTGFIGMVTDGYNIVPLLIKVFINEMGSMVTYVNPEVSHYLNSLGIDPGCRLRPPGPDCKILVKCLEKAVSHLAAATVPCAKDEYFHFVCFVYSRIRLQVQVLIS